MLASLDSEGLGTEGTEGIVPNFDSWLIATTEF